MSIAVKNKKNDKRISNEPKHRDLLVSIAFYKRFRLYYCASFLHHRTVLLSIYISF